MLHYSLPKTILLTALLITLTACTTTTSVPETSRIAEHPDTDAHLFILAGQSNMEGMDHTTTFLPAVVDAFGAQNVIVVKDAEGGQPIRRWDRNWAPLNGKIPRDNAMLYERLMSKVADATKDRAIATVTFIWMQGERDARESHGLVYANSLRRLIAQLESDLNRSDINVVLGRLSDFDLNNEKYPHWTIVRQALVNIANERPSSDWVNTDDLNDGISRNGRKITNDLHYSVEGYKTLGRRFAEQAIMLIRAKAAR